MLRRGPRRLHQRRLREAGQRRPVVAHRAPRPGSVREPRHRRCSRRSTAWCTASPATTSPLDYGPTLVLEHRAGPGGPRFYTLYGHLAGDVAATLSAGDAVRAGGVVARVGTADENGGWPPHLHFQLITDLLDMRGDFPGVADPAERRVWLSLVPDPNLVARIPGGVTARRRPSGDDILASRRDRVGPSLSVSYRRPLTIVRGWMQHLYDADGRAYLDAVNNVPHVGHCHPRVVEAGRRQMAVLNTNTRYLHERLVEYAERLCGHAARPAARLLLRQLRQRGQRARAAPRAMRHRQPRHHRRGRRLPRQHERGRRDQPLQVRRPRRSRRAASRARGAHARRVPRRLPRSLRGCGRALRRARGHHGRSARSRGPADRRLHRRIDPELRRPDRASGRLPPPRLRGRARRRRPVHRRRSPGRLRPRRLALLGLRNPGRRARHRDDGKAHRERAPAGRGGHHARDRPRVRQRHGVLQYLRRQSGVLRDRPGRARRDPRRGPAGPGARGRSRSW